jgi:hypothetical protein
VWRIGRWIVTDLGTTESTTLVFKEPLPAGPRTSSREARGRRRLGCAARLSNSVWRNAQPKGQTLSFIIRQFNLGQKPGTNERSRLRPVIRRISATPFLSRIGRGVSDAENSHENVCLFAVHFCRHSADAILVCKHCSCRDGKRLRWTRRFLRKSHSQWSAIKLLSNDGGSSPIPVWHAGSRVSQSMRHSSH